jgi:cytochrome oxidase assembly protein ShyY1
MIRRQRNNIAHAQRGMSLFGLLFWAIVIGFFAYLAIRVLPTLNEYMTIQKAINKVAADSPTTVAEVRKAFDKQKDIEYSIVSVSGKDLDVFKENERIVIRFAYDKEIPIIEPVFLLVKYEGRSK